ncbi:hypothetical protein PsorP6_013785 [Peronosclerospora sorghi]|uniref:Uncharacterized protein n=1 Tax=Peronosclerospora sorghi TaxID=230839 RepID=A0ACC0VGT5_9STRA|nr:hypothetical protein PsorP6_013785 [Peronosclerospora sorghi]
MVNKSWVYVTLYVDDLLIGAKTFEVIQDIASEIGKKFNLKVLGSVCFILGIEVDYNQEKIQLKMIQGTYIERMVDKYNQDDAKPVYNPVVEDQLLTKNEKKDGKMDNRPYRSLVGSLLYVATGTRPDIAFAVCQLSRHLEQPCEEQWKAAIRVLKYLKSTKITGICYTGISQNITIEAYSDADWAGNRDNQKSTSGVISMVNGAPVIFKSKIQQSVALRTAEAEHLALYLCLQEILWIKSLFNELKIKIDYLIPIYKDNQSEIEIAKNNRYQSRSKNIDIRYHFIRDQIKAKVVDIIYIETKYQLSDLLTKAISTRRFRLLLDKSKIGNFKSREGVGIDQFDVQ